MKKIISLLFALVLAMSLIISGCSGSGEEETSGTGETTKTEGIAKEDLKVGVIHITDPAEGSGYTFTHDQGIVAMQENLGLEDSQIVRKNSISDADPTAIETAMRECIEDGCQVIFATSWGYMDICAELAEEFPDVYFCHGSGYKSNGENFTNYFGRIYQARYLAGIAAGMKTESDKIGFVAAMGKDNAEVTGGLDAFAMGVYSVNPEAQVFVKVTNSWYDPEAETSAAKALIAEGCDVIGQHCDTPNPQLAAEEAGVWSVGYNSDMSKDAPDATLTSVVWDWGVYYTSAVSSLLDGTWDGSNYYGGMKEGLVNITDLADFCAEGTQEAIDEAKATILDGSFNVFDGVIETNDGTTVGEDGKTLSDSDITGKINWYFKNVVVK